MPLRLEGSSTLTHNPFTGKGLQSCRADQEKNLMLSILVGHSYFLRLDPKQLERAKPYPPLATLQVAALLRNGGHQVALFDAMLAQDVAEYEAKLAAAAPQVVVLYEDNFNFLSKMCLAAMRAACCEMIAAARRRGARVIVAGSDVTDAPEVYLQAGAEVALLGEGLAALTALLARLDADVHVESSASLPPGSPGLRCLEGERLRRVSEGRATGLIAYPELPAWDLVDMPALPLRVDAGPRLLQPQHGRLARLPVPLHLVREADLGQPVLHSAAPRPWRRSSPTSSATSTRTTSGSPTTSSVSGPPGCTQFAHDGARGAGAMPFTIQLRADLISEAMAQALREAGCARGVDRRRERQPAHPRRHEQGHDGRRDPHGARAPQGRAASASASSSSSATSASSCTTSSPRASCWRRRARTTSASASPTRCRARSSTSRSRSSSNGKTHWQDSSDLAMMFHGTYSSDFYRAIRDLLHEQVNIGQLDEARQAERYRRAQRRLARRWAALQSSERHFRVARAIGITPAGGGPAMGHILLTHGYFLSEDEKEQQIMKPYAPLGLLYICAYLKSRGHGVEIFDSTFGERAALDRRARSARPAACSASTPTS